MPCMPFLPRALPPLLLVLLVFLAAAQAHAAPAPWYHWRSLVDGQRTCAQAAPGNGWARDSAAFDGPGCQARRKVLIVNMRPRAADGSR